jgi:hypothetical protein
MASQTASSVDAPATPFVGKETSFRVWTVWSNQRWLATDADTWLDLPGATILFYQGNGTTAPGAAMAVATFSAESLIRPNTAARLDIEFNDGSTIQPHPESNNHLFDYSFTDTAWKALSTTRVVLFPGPRSKTAVKAQVRVRYSGPQYDFCGLQNWVLKMELYQPA